MSFRGRQIFLIEQLVEIITLDLITVDRSDCLHIRHHLNLTILELVVNLHHISVDRI
jgi:hypothetical protein